MFPSTARGNSITRIRDIIEISSLIVLLLTTTRTATVPLYSIWMTQWQFQSQEIKFKNSRHNCTQAFLLLCDLWTQLQAESPQNPCSTTAECVKLNPRFANVGNSLEKKNSWYEQFEMYVRVSVCKRTHVAETEILTPDAEIYVYTNWSLSYCLLAFCSLEEALCNSHCRSCRSRHRSGCFLTDGGALPSILLAAWLGGSLKTHLGCLESFVATSLMSQAGNIEAMHCSHRKTPESTNTTGAFRRALGHAGAIFVGYRS